MAVLDAKVISVHWSNTGGNIVWIQDSNGAVYKYMHLDTVDVREGQTVYQGQRLGGIGIPVTPLREPTICTSSTIPTGPTAGQSIPERSSWARPV